MTTPNPFAAPSPTDGSAPAAPDDLTCPVCGKACRSRLGLAAHRRTHERAAGAEPGAGVEPDIGVKKAQKVSKGELAEIQRELAQNVKTVGQVLHPLLLNLKVAKLQDPQARIRVPGTRIDFPQPDFDTHLPYTLISRSELTAKVLVEHAAENETLLKWLVRFNSWFKGGETGSLIGSYAVAAVKSGGLHNRVVDTLQGALIPDVLEQIQAENYQLRQQLEQLQIQMAAAGARRDDRGAGN